MVKLTENELLHLIERNNISQAGYQEIQRVRASQPSRRVQQGGGNMTVRYPSAKMQVTMQAESNKVEYPFMLLLEYDEEVYEYYDQPPQILCESNTNKGKRNKYWITPDYFLISSSFIGWMECKPAGKLEELALNSPHLYAHTTHQDEQRTDNLQTINPQQYWYPSQRWDYLPGSDYAAQLGLKYGVYSSSQIPWIFLSNIQFLAEYLRYPTTSTMQGAVVNCAKEIVQTNLGITLADLVECMSEKSDPHVGTDNPATICAIGEAVDVIYTLISTGELYVDLHSARLVDKHKVAVYIDADTARASVFRSQFMGLSNGLDKLGIEISPGAPILWDFDEYTIAHIGKTEIALLETHTGGRLLSLPNDIFDSLVRNKKIVGIKSPEDQARISPSLERVIARANGRDEAIANARFVTIAPYVLGKTGKHLERSASDHTIQTSIEMRQQYLQKKKPHVTDRTMRRWRAKYKQAEQTLGAGYYGLLPHTRSRGNRIAKLPYDSLEMLEQFVRDIYETSTQKHIMAVYREYDLACKQKGISAASYKTFARYVHKRPLYQQTLKRQGKRAAYKYEPILLELSYTTPRQGDHPWQVLYIDHTEADVELVCEATGRNLGRPWISFGVDGYTRKIACIVSSFDQPSYRTLMLLLRDFVRRWNRFPEVIIVDGAKEFSSVYFESLLARFGCIKKTRPSKPRFGSIIERMFGAANQELLYNLRGNTQITKNVRQVTKAYNPKGQAVWHLEAFHAALCEWAYDVYDTTRHPALGQSPREALLEGIRNTGARAHIKQPYDSDFVRLTMPSTPKGTARVQVSGIKINGIYYSCDAFREPGVLHQDLEVRYDPYDIGHAYAFVHGRWTECLSEYHVTLRSHSEREVALITAAIRDKYKQNNASVAINGKKLAEFIQRMGDKEPFLEQRMKDRASRSLFLQPLVSDEEYKEQAISSYLVMGNPEEESESNSCNAIDSAGAGLPGGLISDSQQHQPKFRIFEDL